ncbi:formylglycine-generating enzyme family protein [Pseudactinotalea terrae]|uniref:formylglycine-generating enzyme family protein n=1 Tax=Pseudactinotalea terrae TaxID=1743262 RepID=UPI0012E176C2|nr:formylglycine-generating enzyme family protein [Pseudactinotalea terrae]
MSEHDLVPLSGGTFLMGSEDFYPDERPVHQREVGPFAIDRHPVTNAQYAEFVSATGYVTVAERELDPADFPGADPAALVPGAMVFTPTEGPVDLGNWRHWWRWQPGAAWNRPFGPDSDLDGLLDHPVVHVAFEDATAYAAWRGLRLPTEAEHELAARGGHEGRMFAWGADPYPDGVPQANTWIGRFPYDNQGYGGTSPVGSFPANDFGLVDLIGNTWEWTTDIYRPGHHPAPSLDLSGRPSLLNPEPAGAPRRVLKGGSFLCSPEYCLRFRPAARSPQTEDTGMSHVGFRCAQDR